MSRLPDYRLRVLDKANNKSATLGAGWLNKDGSITLNLNVCTTLSYESMKDLSVNLFPVDTKDKK